MRDFKGRTAVITGAGSGIGAALAHLAAREGMNLVLADINLADLEAVAAAIDSPAIALHRTDVADPEAVQALADGAWSRFGEVSLLCNNAGVVPGGRHRPVWDYAPEDWRWAFGVNMDGVVNGIRSFVPRMLAEGRPGHILNTASVAGFVSGEGSAVYGASKHAAVRITEALYAGLRARNAPIGVTMLCPGLVATRIYEAERSRPAHLQSPFGQPAEAPEFQAISDNLFQNAPSPEEVAAQAFDGIRKDQFYVFTSARYDGAIAQRAQAIVNRENPQFDSLMALSEGKADLDKEKI
ncbi:NAD(P)-dependent dehydrogenase (short-subunit alcohol dehydrogenase family) [Sphingobium xenophagum]|uniref:NAD(P)-dependent dehydrogenase (Short-subunit alcohol dehydrogenase family) n=1 Tax=Sphingobium xenophagum TaxID=121428 RepID=A0ABU1X566_SPHXE|nr:SDR family NAD(P)-dependent oxidoreductase [Sphingobium xenophagum]MDR7156723.1 NAD(P)-dependent dehydrogenase (short-subunit alcohol dehydrogenase family) [Sphingobium xenophagum]